MLKIKIWFLSFFFFTSLLCGETPRLLEEIPWKENPRVGYIHLSKEESIGPATYLYIKYALDFFIDQKVCCVLLDLDTPGGEVFSALQIVDELKKIDENHQIPVIAFVDKWALSAGALLAYSCRFIGSTSDGSMGAAEPVLMSSEGKMETASEKIISALRAEFKGAASFYGRNPDLAECMVDKDLILVERNGQIIALSDESKINHRKDSIIKPKGKLLTLDAKQMQMWGVADFVVKSGFEQAPFVEGVPLEMIKYHNVKIRFFAFLTKPIISSLLMMGLMIGLYATIQSQTWGFSAVVGLFCLGFILLSSFATQTIEWLELILLCLGFILLLFDVFVSGGIGFLAILGFLLVITAVIALFLPSLEGVSWTFDFDHKNIKLSVWIERLSLFLFTVFLFFAVFLPVSGYFFRKTHFFSKIALQNKEEKEEVVESLPEVGLCGLSFSALRPFGKVELCGRVYEAQTEGEWIEPGCPVEVIAYRENRLLVKQKKTVCS